MEQSEIMRRVVGILTQATDWNSRMVENIDDEDVRAEAEDGVVNNLVYEMMPSFEFPAATSLKEAAPVIGREIGDAVLHLVGAFSFAFVQLAEIHDTGRTDIKSSDMLRDIALQAETIFGDDSASE